MKLAFNNMVFCRAFILSLACFMFFFPFSYFFEGQSHLVSIVFDLMHFPALFLMTLLALKKLPTLNIKIKLLAAVVTVFLIEIIQSLTGREPSVGDIVWGLVGITSAYVFNRYPLMPLRVILFMPYLMAVIIQSVMVLTPYNRLPMVSEGESLLDGFLFENLAEITQTPPRPFLFDKEHGLVMKGFRLDYPWTGMSYKLPLSKSIDQYKQLSFEFYSPTAVDSVDVVITGSKNRIVRSANVNNTGWSKHSVSINSSQKSRIGRVERVSFVLGKKSAPAWYLLDNIAFIE